MQLNLRCVGAALVVAFGLCAGALQRASALDPPPPEASPTPSPTPSHTPLPPTTENDETLPLIIGYEDGVETQTEIKGGTSLPIGVPPDKSVSVTLFLDTGVPGSPIMFGLLDGGVVAAVDTPGGDLRAQSSLDPPTATLNSELTVQFNFQPGRVLGLYRVLVTVPPKQFLLQFYAVRPRSTPSPQGTPLNQ